MFTLSFICIVWGRRKIPIVHILTIFLKIKIASITSRNSYYKNETLFRKNTGDDTSDIIQSPKTVTVLFIIVD